MTIAVQNPGGLSAVQVATASVNGLGSAGNGTFTYQSESTVTASASGTVAAVHVSEGSAVCKGQVLITLGGDDLEDQLQNAADSLRNAELSMENTQKQLENYTITSPISGTVIDKEYKAGDTVESGKTLCTIYDLSYLEMTLNIDELDISTVEAGQTVQITAEAVEGKTFTGVVTKVSVAGTTSGGITSYPVTVRIDETDGLLPGMNVDAEIVLEEAADTLAIPSSAVTRGSGNTSLVLITQDSPSAESAVEQESPEGYVYVQVETGISDNSYVQILSGLQEGDTVAYVTRSTESGSMMMGGMPGAMGGDMPAGMPSGMGSAPGGGMPSGGGPGGGSRDERADRISSGLQDLSDGDTTVRAADHISMRIEKGEFVAIVGQSGSGKSTCMNIIGCLDVPTSGTYLLDGRDVGQMDTNQLAAIRNELLGFIFQQYNLLPKLDLLENVEVPLMYAGVPKAERRQRAREVLEQVGLGDKLHHLTNQLSGGQQQRVSIARALAGRPAVILADEPTGALDSHTSREVLGDAPGPAPSGQHGGTHHP